jgi:hypothetical protein
MIIKVRADMNAIERITIVADWFEVESDGVLSIYREDADKDPELVASFRQWAYVIKDPPQDDGGSPIPMIEPPAIKLPEPRPLNLGAANAA